MRFKAAETGSLPALSASEGWNEAMAARRSASLGAGLGVALANGARNSAMSSMISSLAS